MNICFLIGKIISDIKFDFIIGNNKYFNKEKVTIVRFKIELLDGNIVNVIGYNSIADKCFRKLKKDKIIIIQGVINSLGKIEIKDFDCIG